MNRFAAQQDPIGKYLAFVPAAITACIYLLPSIKDRIDPGNKVLAILSLGAMVVLAFFVKPVMAEVIPSWWGRASRPGLRIVGLSVAIVAWHMLRTFQQDAGGMGLKEAGIKLVFGGMAGTAFVGTSLYYVQRGWGGLYSVAMVIGMIAGFNILASLAGYSADLEQELLSIGAHLSIDGAGVRFQVPFWYSSGAFYPFAGVGLCCGLIAAALNRRNLLALAFLAPCVLASAYVAIRGESISTFAGIGVSALAALLVFVRSNRLKVWSFWCLASLSTLIAAACYQSFLPSLLERLTPNWIIQASPRGAMAVFNLNGRAELYAYGMELLADRRVGIIGQGPVNRDAGIALASADATVLRQNIGFHNASMEFLISHGPVAFVAIAILFAAAGIWALRHGPPMGPPIAAEIGLLGAVVMGNGILSAVGATTEGLQVLLLGVAVIVVFIEYIQLRLPYQAAVHRWQGQRPNNRFSRIR